MKNLLLLLFAALTITSCVEDKASLELVFRATYDGESMVKADSYDYGNMGMEFSKISLFSK